LRDPISKTKQNKTKPSQKKAGGVAPGVGPEFKYQYQKKKKKRKKKGQHGSFSEFGQIKRKRSRPKGNPEVGGITNEKACAYYLAFEALGSTAHTKTNITKQKKRKEEENKSEATVL
jgi:hypothetical protein